MSQIQPTDVISTAPLTLKENEFRVSEVPYGAALLVDEVAVFNVAGRFCATQGKCTHRQGPLSKGKLDGSTVTCPNHGAQFNVCSGEVLRGPAKDPLKTYRVIVDRDIGPRRGSRRPCREDDLADSVMRKSRTAKPAATIGQT